MEEAKDANCWHIQLGTEMIGPLTTGELRRLAQQGAINRSTLVSADRSTWRNAETVDDIRFGVTPPLPSQANRADRESLTASKSRARVIVNDLLLMDFRKDIVPFEADSMRLLAKDVAFWAAMLLGVIPLLIGTLADSRSQLTAFAIFFAAVWGVIFKLLVVRDSGDWRMPVAAFLFTGIVGYNVLLFVYQFFFPKVVLEWALSQNPLVSLIGCLGPIGVCEELCKIAPVVAYVLWKRSAAKPLTTVVIGVFSGLGFGAFENLRYDDVAVAKSFDLVNLQGAQGLVEGVQGAMVLALLRCLATVFSHAVMSGLFAYFIAAALVLNRRRGPFLLVGLGIAAVLHGTYDWLVHLQPTFSAITIGLSFAMFYPISQGSGKSLRRPRGTLVP
jgi:RsiW-degrading membrane proteinase PrsW (M82 family)